MRILVVSNFYPPYYIGGHEQGCLEVVEGLKKKGHQLVVLTSTYGVSAPSANGQVYRWLQTHIGRTFTTRELFQKEWHNRRCLKQLIQTFHPDVIYFWHLWQASLSLVYVAQQHNLPICYYVGDDWISDWAKIDDWFSWWRRSPHNPLKRWAKDRLRLLFNNLRFTTQPDIPNLSNAQFVSHFIKNSALRVGRPVNDAPVIHRGVDIDQFPVKPPLISPPTRLLFVGQLVPHKGVHVVVDAFRLLVEQYKYSNLTLTIVGGTIFSDYEAQLKAQVKAANLQSKVQFTGPLSRDRIPGIYQTHDILIVPSTWDEPFGLIYLEAMASGLAVVGTATGGSAEILQHQVNGLVFAREDAGGCAACIRRLITDPALYNRLSRQGRQTVEQKFRLEYTIDNIEQALLEMVQSAACRNT